MNATRAQIHAPISNERHKIFLRLQDLGGNLHFIYHENQTPRDIIL